MPVTVLWGNDRLQFDLPSPDTTLASLTLAIAAYTQLSPDAFSLVHDGAVMRDDAATSELFSLTTHTEPTSSQSPRTISATTQPSLS